MIQNRLIIDHQLYTMEHQSLRELEATGTQKICLFLDWGNIQEDLEIQENFTIFH